MERMDGTSLYLTACGIIEHNQNDKRQQKHLLQLLSKRGDIEHDYLSALSEWQEEYESLINADDFLYNGEIKDVFSLLSKEAETAANIHYHIFNKIYLDACGTLKSGSNSIESCPGQSDRESKYVTIVSNFEAIQCKRAEKERVLDNANQNRVYALDAAKDVEEQVQGQKRYGALPITPKKLAGLKEKLKNLQQNVDIHKINMSKAQQKLTQFDMSNGKKLTKVVNDLEAIAKAQLQISIESVQKALQVFREQEDIIVRKEKQKLLFKSDQLLSKQKIEAMKTNCLVKVKSKVAAKISNANGIIMEVKPASTETNTADGSEVYHNIPGTMTEGIPEGCLPPLGETAMCPPPLRNKETREATENSTVKLPLKETQSTPLNIKKCPEQPTRTTDTVEIYYNGSDDSTEERNQQQIMENEQSKYKTPTDFHVSPPSVKGSKKSNCSIETIEWIAEHIPPPLDKRIIVRDFCISEDESEDSIITSTKTGFKKMCEDTSTSECEEADEDNTSPDILFDHFSHAQSVIHLRNTRVMARFDYIARKAGELNFKKGQVIKQKLGKDEYGFSYGWTRSNKFVHKHYGYYPSELVMALPIDDHSFF